MKNPPPMTGGALTAEDIELSIMSEFNRGKWALPGFRDGSFFLGELAAVGGAEDIPEVPVGVLLLENWVGIDKRRGELLWLPGNEAGLMVDKLLVRDGLAELRAEAATDVLWLGPPM